MRPVTPWYNQTIGPRFATGCCTLGYPQHHKPLKVTDKPAEQWNHFEIKLENGLVTVHLNGELVLDQFECKFSKPTGPLVLQHHGTPLWLKNIYLKELK